MEGENEKEEAQIFYDFFLSFFLDLKKRKN